MQQFQRALINIEAQPRPHQGQTAAFFSPEVCSRQPQHIQPTKKSREMKSEEKRDEELFQRTDADASFTSAAQAGRVRRGGALMMKGRPCRVTDVAT